MSNKININFSEDANYRYKMDIPAIRQEGHGHNVFFVIDNMKAIADTLHRDPVDLTQFFNLACGSQGRYDPVQGRSKFTGTKTPDQILVFLKNFIVGFILCKTCDNPETTPNYAPGCIKLKCAACGSFTTISITNDNKMGNYLLRKYLVVSKDATVRQLPPQSVTTKLSKILNSEIANKAEAIKTQITKYVDDNAILEGEIIPALTGTYFKYEFKPITQFIEFIRPFVLAYEQQTQILASLECVYKKYFADPKLADNINGTIQQLLMFGEDPLISKEAMMAYRSDGFESFVPFDFHQQILTIAEPVLSWYDDQENEEDEDEPETE